MRRACAAGRDGRGVRRLRVRHDARLRRRRARRRRGRACALVAELALARRRRASACACTRWTTRPSRPTWPPSPAAPATAWPHHGAQGRAVADVVQRRRGARRRRRQPAAAACADRVAAAVHRAFDIAAHPRMQSLCFGLMDFVSAHGGAIPADGMGVARPVRAPAGGARQAGDRRGLPRARQGAVALRGDRVQGHRRHASRRGARRGESATRGCGASTPTRSGPSSRLSRPARDEVDRRAERLPPRRCRMGADQLRPTLHDRASYRYFWQVLERAHRTGQPLPTERRAGSRPRVTRKTFWRHAA